MAVLLERATAPGCDQSVDTGVVERLVGFYSFSRTMTGPRVKPSAASSAIDWPGSDGSGRCPYSEHAAGSRTLQSLPALRRGCGGNAAPERRQTHHFFQACESVRPAIRKYH